jgi:Arc/MetJ family transcription regulator
MATTNVEIDGALMADAMAALGTRTVQETIDVALEKAARNWRLRKVAELRGSTTWEGDLMEWRRSKDFPE